METQENTKLVDGNEIYEVGYLIVSSIPEEKVPAETEALHALITKEGGEIISHENAVLRPLAYTMIKEATGRHHRYNEGYFGWVKFEIPRANIDAIKKALDTRENMLRYLLITTVRESTLAPQKVLAAKELKKEDGVSEEVKPVSVEELDKTIDDMVKGA